MKNIISFFLGCMFAFGTINAQVPPEAFSYNGIARHTDGSPVSNQSIALLLNILDGGGTVYSERHECTTDAFGAFQLQIGSGDPQLPTLFSNINWTIGQKELAVSIDITGGTSYINLGSTPFLSVPYSLVTGGFILPYEDSYSGTDSEAALEIIRSGGINKTAISGVSTSINGIGITGSVTGTYGIGVYAKSNGATNIALSVVSPDNGTSAFISGGKTIIMNNPPAGNMGNLNILRDTGTALPASIVMGTEGVSGPTWRMNVNSDAGSGTFSIFNPAGTEVFRIGANGNIIFNAALGSGSPGQVLTNNGPNYSPSWSTPVNTYNDTYLFDQPSSVVLNSTLNHVAENQFSGIPFSFAGTGKVVINFSHAKIFNGASGGGNSRVRFVMELVNTATNTIVNQVDMIENVPNNEVGNISYTHHCWMGGGTYKVNIKAQIMSGDSDVTLQGVSGNNSPGQLSIQIFRQ